MPQQSISVDDFLKSPSPTPQTAVTPNYVASSPQTTSSGGISVSDFLNSPTPSQPYMPSAAQPKATVSPGLQFQGGHGGISVSDFLTGTSTPSAGIPLAPTGSPAERDESDRFTQIDPNANWLEKTWALANKPLTETLFGWGQYRQGAGGVERFAEKTLSGLTSPLSLITTAAFLPAGIAEGVAGSALKEGLTEGVPMLGERALTGLEAAANVEKYAKAVNLAEKARVADQSIQAAVESGAEMPYQEFLNYGKYLRAQGLRETDMLGESFARRGISQSLAKAGVTPGKALSVAKGVETLVNAGFTYNAVHGAMYAYPRALDQLQNGDYDGATESILEAGANTVFGALGLAHSLHSVEDILPGLNTKRDLRLADETQAMLKMFKRPEREMAEAQFGIEAQRKAHHIEMLKAAGLEDLGEKLKNIPAEDRYRWDKEFVNAFNDIVSTKEKREALANKQMQFFAAMDAGKSPELASQMISILVHALKMEDWAKLQNLPIGVRDERTIRTIAQEEARNSLYSKDQFNLARTNIDNWNKEIKGLQDQLKETPNPAEREGIQQTIDKRKDQINAEQLRIPDLADEMRRNARWEKVEDRFKIYQGWMDRLQKQIEDNPDDATLAVRNKERIQALNDRIGRTYEELYREKYDHLNRQLDEAAKDIEPKGPGDRNALDEFNKKLRIMGINSQDVQIIENQFPHFRQPAPSTEPPLESRTYPKPVTEAQKAEVDVRLNKVREQLRDLKTQIDQRAADITLSGPDTSAIRTLWNHNLELSKSADHPNGDRNMARARVNQYLRDNNPGWFVDIGEGTEALKYNYENDQAFQRLFKQFNELNQDHIRLSYAKARELPADYIGQIHTLPNGSKLLYVPDETFRKIQKASGSNAARIPQGQHMPKSLVDMMVNKLKSAKTPNQKLIDLIEQSRGSNGDITMARTPASHGGTLGDKLWTIREELIHGWQGRFSRTVAQNHLTKPAYERLFNNMPPAMLAHLKRVGYNIKDKPVAVLEAAAKMMAVRPWELEPYFGISREEAASFLHNYFTEVKNQWGENAFDSLAHISKYAKDLKEKFIESYRPKQPEPAAPGPGEAAAPVEPVGAGGGGGTPTPPSGGGTGGGGEPPKPPEEEYPYQHDPDWRKKFPPSTINGGSTSGFPIEAWQTGPQHRMIPDDIQELINKARERNFDDKHIEYAQKYINALRYTAENKWTPQENRLYDSLRKADDDNWTVGYNGGIISSIVENHIHHLWGDDPKNSAGHATVQRAMSGAFGINASQARHRSWGTAIEGILRGRQLKVHDPAAIIAHDANNIASAMGHRQVIENLVKSGLKASDGLPLAVYLGRGVEVPGEDGSPSSVIVNPNVVKNILMSPQEIQRLQNANLLETYIKEGTVTDKTPYVNQENIPEWLEATKDKLNDLINKNPLLANPKDRVRHEAAWGQLQLFAKDQAGKIAEYLRKTLDDIRQNPQNGKYIAADPANKPGNLTGAEYLDKVLHGGTASGRRVITPEEMRRLEEYAQRNENYANGLNGKGNGEISPAIIAKLLLQEQKHLDPELKAYLDEHHDFFLPRDKQGNIIKPQGGWDRKTFNVALWHVAHAAENQEYPQLIRDMDDLNYVQKNLTSVNAITQQMHKEEALKRLQDINDRQPRKYLWSPKGYIPIDHPSFRGYRWMAPMPNGGSVLAQSSIAVHPEVYDYIVNRLGLERSKLREDKGIGKITGPLLKAGAQFKSTILSGSPFHIIQEALRGLMIGINPFVRPNPIENLNEEFPTAKGPKKLIRLGIENGLTVFNNRFMAEDAAVGVASHGGMVSKIPVYGKFVDQIHDFLFNRYIPSLKVSGFKRMFEKYQEAHPDWSDDAVAHAAAYHVNSAFGGINWREMGRSATTQDWFHLVALAPDWLESEMRFAAGMFRNMGIGPAKYDPNYGKNFTREQVAYTAATLWTTMRVLNMLYSGNAHFETPFGLATKDKDGREIEFSVRTMPTDILHMASDPMGFLNGRMSPVMRTGLELYTGRNQYGQKLTPGEKYVDMISNMVPIWGQSTLKSATHLATSADVPGYAQVAKAAGATAQVYRTPAEKTAANLASERSEEGSMNPAKIARHRLLLQLEDDMRNGKIKVNDLEQMVAYGNLPIADAKAIMKNVQETAGHDPEEARLYSRVARLDFQGAMAVWDDANPGEKKMLENLIRKKAAAYIKKSVTDFTPDERAKDPMFKRARQIAPILEHAPAQ